jgi:anti-sigma B factor antagonist
MEASFNQQDSDLRVTLNGDLTGGSDAMKFQQLLREQMQGSLKRIIIDVSNVGFVNSSGLGMLLAARQSATDHGADLFLERPQEQLKNLLEITKLSSILGVSDAGVSKNA